jgi:hypothetical protein
MPDYAMCDNDDCPLRRSCRRHEASGRVTPTPGRQTYGAFLLEVISERDSRGIDCIVGFRCRGYLHTETAKDTKPE